MLLREKTRIAPRAAVRSAAERKTLFSALEPYVYLLPAFLVFGTFLFYPFLKTLYVSCFLTNKYGQAKVFVGLGNYADILQNPSFWNSLWITLQFVLMVAVGGLIVGLFTSLLTAKAFPGRTFAVTTYAMPIAIASAAASMTFRMILHPTTGLLNNLLGTAINWRGDPAWALLSVAVMTVWLSSGINFIFLSAGLRNIPDELYEAASIDGAGYFGKLWYVTLPSLSPALFFQIVINVIYAFQSFSQIRLLTDGGPGEATNVIVYAIYRDAFFNFRFGTASARSVVLFVLILIVTLIQFSMEKRSVQY